MSLLAVKADFLANRSTVWESHRQLKKQEVAPN